MKKTLLSLVLALAALFCFCACGTGEEPQQQIMIPPWNGGFFIFGHSAKHYWLRTSAPYIGLPATQLLLATHKWVTRVK